VLGFAVPQFGESAHLDVGELARFASTAEQLGADSLWVGDRLLAAVHPTVGYAGTDTIPEQFRTSLDPFIALTVAATVTTKRGWAAACSSPPGIRPRNWAASSPASTSSAAVGCCPGSASGGRRRSIRPQAPRSSVVARNWMNCWTHSMHCGRRTPLSTPARAGRSPSRGVELKPVQRPRPPIYLGAFTPPGLKRVGTRADGWMAAMQVPGGVRLEALNRQRDAIDEAAREAGRDPSTIHTYVRINVAEATPVNKVAAALGAPAGNGYPDAFVDLLYVATGTDAHLEWVERLLAS
jgi:alkanesulfonate monooxygenase SsuD/methylene tetrahydromethanopterin reductase-like flavin-dependent oxidoreductase (luciferase family)